MSMVKASEAQLTPPPKAFLEAMNRLIEESAKAGCVMVEAGGLLPSANGARIRLSGGKVTVTDGPFTEAKEVVGGYAMFDVPSRDVLNGRRVSWICIERICRTGKAKPKSARSRVRVRSCATKPTRPSRLTSDQACGLGVRCVSR
jgi:hypothetical protein